MAIKQSEILSRADFDEAVVRLRLNVSDIAKSTGIPRTYLSEFRNDERKLRPEHQAKLRDFFQSKGVEFDVGNGASARTDGRESPHPSLAVGTVCYFPVRADLTVERVRAVLAEIERNDKTIRELLTRPTLRTAATILGGSEKFSEETDEDLRTLFAHLGVNYLFVRYLTGIKNEIEQQAAGNTLQAVVVDILRESIERAGLVEIIAPAVTAQAQPEPGASPAAEEKPGTEPAAKPAAPKPASSLLG